MKKKIKTKQQIRSIYRNLALVCIIGILASYTLAKSDKPKLQKIGLVGLGASLMAGMGIATTQPRNRKEEYRDQEELDHHHELEEQDVDLEPDELEDNHIFDMPKPPLKFKSRSGR